jgi:CheY-like chemotaxis protein
MQAAMPEPGESTGPRLLLCDDSPIERLALAHFLRASGYKVDEASDGQSALQFLRHRRVDLLLLDLEMPDVDGFDVLNYVAEHRKALPVILMSGMKPEDIQHGMYGLRSRELPPLLIKPLDPRQVLDMIEMHLSDQLPQHDDLATDYHEPA